MPTFAVDCSRCAERVRGWQRSTRLPASEGQKTRLSIGDTSAALAGEVSAAVLVLATLRARPDVAVIAAEGGGGFAIRVADAEDALAVLEVADRRGDRAVGVGAAFGALEVDADRGGAVAVGYALDAASSFDDAARIFAAAFSVGFAFDTFSAGRTDPAVAFGAVSRLAAFEASSAGRVAELRVSLAITVVLTGSDTFLLLDVADGCGSEAVRV